MSAWRAHGEHMVLFTRLVERVAMFKLVCLSVDVFLLVLFCWCW